MNSPILTAASVEALESRKLLSASFDANVLVIEGTWGDDFIELSLSPTNSNRLVVDNNGEISTWRLSSLDEITINARGGNDEVWVDETWGSIYIPININGGWGDDTLCGSDGFDVITGWYGEDYIYGYDGDDILSGQYDDDFIYGGYGDDWGRGGWGDDFFEGGYGEDLGWGWYGEDILVGGYGDDDLYGQYDADDIYGEYGDDYVSGGRGTDEIYYDTGDTYDSRFDYEAEYYDWDSTADYWWDDQSSWDQSSWDDQSVWEEPVEDFVW